MAAFVKSMTLYNKGSQATPNVAATASAPSSAMSATARARRLLVVWAACWYHSAEAVGAAAEPTPAAAGVAGPHRINVAGWPKQAIGKLQAFHCTISDSYTDKELVKLQKLNCDKALGAVHDFRLAIKKVDRATIDDWSKRAGLAEFLCNRSASSKDPVEAAWLAVNAWGAGIMDGAECCTLPHAPYCLAERAALSSYAVGALFALLALLFAGTGVASCLMRPSKSERQPIDEEPMLPYGTTRVPDSETEGLYDELRHKWLSSHCLRALPEARAFAQATASTFSALQVAFDFQPDNVRNQYEHMLSLWRSHCATVADRSVQDGIKVDEAGLLEEALGDMHAELLEGFTKWRAAFYKAQAQASSSSNAETAGQLPAALRRQDRLLRSVPETCAKQVAESAAFLLIWGEAGNVRFMPEVLYFLTELLLSSDGAHPEALYGAGALAGRDAAGAPFRSHLFLSRVLRPMYNAIFDAWYDRVDIDPQDGRNVKRLREGYEKYLPSDVANYDDWNEFFCSPARLAKGVFLEDGTCLLKRARGQRFSALHRVDWAASLDPYEVKSHREVHSLWGVFASTHRIWLLHAVLFAAGLCFVIPAPAHRDGMLLQGSSLEIRLAAIALLVPLHGLLWTFAKWETSSHRGWWRRPGCIRSVARDVLSAILWALPVATYFAVRRADIAGGETQMLLNVHFAVSALGLLLHLVASARSSDKLWRLTPVPLYRRALRYVFWLVVLAVKSLVSLVIFRALADEVTTLDLVTPGREPVEEIRHFWMSTSWGADVLVWLLLWSLGFFLFVADTGVWYQAGCSVLGICSILTRRKKFAWERAISKIPERFSEKVFTFSSSGGALKHDRADRFSTHFPVMWDRIMETMHQEDKCKGEICREQSFGVRSNYTSSEGPPSDAGSVQLRLAAAESEDSEGDPAKMPQLFNRDSVFRVGKNGSLVTRCPQNKEMQWRLNSFARCLGMPMPRPFRAPYIPGITVLVPHFQEDILVTREDLYSGREETVPLIDWVKARYTDEFDAFLSRVQNRPEWAKSPAASHKWAAYSDEQWDMIAMWASMRLQTLWRTVAGMSMYQAVLQCHYQAQADEQSALAASDVWDPSDCFTCLVSMQQYRTFTQLQLQQTNRMLDHFPTSLKIAFIDWTNKNITAEADGVHPRQRRRYFSCLIDAESSVDSEGRRAPKLRVELPGFPILGDGKSDNQNHAIPFMRGALCQCIDSNQGAYLEQMLLLPCVLGEFRTKHRGENQAKRIIGLPEHITSDFGSIGDFAAGAELTFGTVLQRSHALLGARMHYGHPDIMNKQYMIQQGGVSKATKTLNLSEDIFAGMDFMLRGDGRQIRHCEYFYLTKGRDLGFNAVMGFFSKISSGTGEQILTRQMFRLGQILPLPEALSFFYAHAGYYLTQAFISLSMPVLVSTWLIVLAADCEDSFRSFMNCPEASAGEAMAATLSAWCSWVIVFFLAAQALPLFAQVWMEMGFRSAVSRLVKQWLTFSWCFFIFQAKLVGFYMLNEIRYGGAVYVGTGRGLPTHRSPFIGRLSEDGSRLDVVGGLYLDYAKLAYYDAVKLLLGAIVAVYLGGIAGGFAWTFMGITIFSWLYSPFIFNPYQFSRRYFAEDLRSWFAFFFRNGSSQWAEWYKTTQLHPRRGFRHSVWDIKAFFAYFALAVWFAIMSGKLNMFGVIFPGGNYGPVAGQALALAPPVGSPLVYCILATILECLCCGARRAAQSAGKKPKSARAAGGSVAQAGRRRDEDEESDEVSEASAVAASDAASGAQAPRCPPLPLSAAIVVALEVCEAMAPLRGLHHVGWHRAFVAGLVLKLLVLRLVLFLGEGVLRCRFFGRMGPLGRPLEAFVLANRFAKDLFVSLFLFCTLSVGVLLNTLNEALCPNCNLHQLLIYRARPLRPDLA